MAVFAMVLALIPLRGGVALANVGVVTSPALLGQTIWTNQQQMFFTVTADNTVAASVYAKFGGCAPTATVQCSQIFSDGQAPVPVGAGTATQFNYSVLLLPGAAPQLLTVSYATLSVYHSVYASVGLDRSILEPGAPSSTLVSFTLFGHDGASVNQSSVAVHYAGTAVTPSFGSVTAAGGLPVSFTPSLPPGAGSQVTVNYSDTSGNSYQASFMPSVATQWITGQVLDSSGHGVGGVQILAFANATSAAGPSAPIAPTFTGPDGTYMLPLPAGSTGGFTVEAQPQNGQDFVGASATVASVNSTGATSAPAITLAAPAVHLTGQITDAASGKPLANAFVNVFQEPQNNGGPGTGTAGTGTGAGTQPVGGAATTDASGNYAINLPAAGQYEMMVQPPFGTSNLVAYGPTAETLATGDQTVNVAIQGASATVTGTVYFQGTPLANGEVVAMSAPTGPGSGPGGFAFAQTNSSGQYTLALGQGTWQLQVNGMNPSTNGPLQGVQVNQAVSPSGVLSGGSLVVGASTGAVTDNITVAPYAASVDVAVEVAGTPPNHVEVFAQRASQGGAAGPAGGFAGPGIFASDTTNSDGTANTGWTTNHLVHLHLAPGTWTIGVIRVHSNGEAPRVVMLPPVTVKGSDPNVTVTPTVSTPLLSVAAGNPPVLTVDFPARSQVATVTVVDANKSPIAGAFVGAFNAAGDFVQADGSSPVTDASGQATLHLTKGRWQVVVNAREYGFAQPQALDTTSGAGTYSLTFDMGSPRPDQISGTVTYKGSPVPGARVVAQQPGHRPAFGVAGPLGDYSINVTPGTWTLAVHAHGYDTSGLTPVTAPALTQTHTSDTGVNIDISSAVQRNITLSGTVVDASNQPVAGATVSATVYGAAHAQRPVRAVTLPDGTWSMQVSPGNWTLGAIAPGYSPSAPTTESNVTADVSGIALTLGATLPGTITGTVDATGGTPLQNAVVTAVNPSTHAVYQALTDTSGTYSLPVADGSYDVRAEAAGYTPQATTSAVTVSGSGSVTENFTLASGVAVSGTVTVGGVATADVEVDAVNAADPSVIVTTSTGSNGDYTLNLGAGAWTLTAYAPSDDHVSAGLKVTVGSTAITGQNLSVS